MENGESLQKKNIKDTLADGTKDTTKPVEELLKTFVGPNYILSLLYRKLMAKPFPSDISFREPHKLQPGHPVNSFPTDWDGILPTNLYQPLGYKCTLPTIMTNARNNAMTDPVLEHLKTKQRWKRVVQLLRDMGDRQQKEIPLTMATEKVWHCSKIATDLAVCLQEDPFPYFDSYYNWHYAGNGNLQVLEVGGEECVLHAELSRLYLSKFSRRRLRVKRKYIFSYDCGEGNNILETICNTKYIALRFMQKVLLLKIIEKDGIANVKKIKEIGYDTILTSISFDLYQSSILFVTRLDNTVVIVNLDIIKGRTLKLAETDSLVNNWGTVVGVDRETFCHVSRETITVYDKRNNNKLRVSDGDINSNEHCDKFNVVRKLESGPLMYLGTRHNLFLADLRQTTRFVQRWTTMTYCDPTYLSHCRMEDGKDLVLVSSQWPEDHTVVVNNSDKILNRGYSRHMTMPYQLLSVEQLLLEARQKMMCLDPYNPIDRRLYSAVTGAAAVATGSKYLMLTQNAIGDIFCNTLYPEEDKVEDDSVEKLHEWSKTLKDLSRTINVTAIIELGDFWRKLKKIPREYKIGGDRAWPHLTECFTEDEIFQCFSNDKIDEGLLHAWHLTPKTPLYLDLDFSDSEL